MKLVKWFQSLGAESPPEKQPDPRVMFFETQRARAETVAKDAEANIDQIRKRADAWGKGAIALGSTGLTAVGIGKLTDYAPAGHWVAAGIVLVGFALAIACLVFVATRLTRVSNPIVMSTRISLMSELDAGNDEAEPEVVQKGKPKSERKIVEEIYQRSADLNGARSFHAYAVVATLIEATFTRVNEDPDPAEKILEVSTFDRFATELIKGIGDVPYLLGDDKPEPGDDVKVTEAAKNYIKYALEHRELAEAKSELVRAEVAAVAARAQAAVVRQRMVNATSSPRTGAALVAIPALIIGALILANAAQSFNDSDEETLQTQKMCIEIAASMKEKGLKLADGASDPCKVEVLPAEAAPKTDVSTEQSARADAIEAALDNYRGCLASSDQPATECAPIMALLVKYGQP